MNSHLMNTPTQAQPLTDSEQRNIILARGRLALLYVRRNAISQSMADAVGTLLTATAEKQKIW